jgi:hypothetical protein
LDEGLKPDITVAARMDDANETVLDYYLLRAKADLNRLLQAEVANVLQDQRELFLVAVVASLMQPPSA